MRILIIAAYFPPLNNIASSRISAFKRYLEQLGCEIDVITRYYSKNQLSGEDLLLANNEPQNFDQPYIQIENIIYTNFKKNNTKLALFNKLPAKIRGLYSHLNSDIYQYGWLSYIIQAFEEKLKDKKYDFILASYGPSTTFEAAEILSLKYDIPWVADYRDLFIDFKLNYLAHKLRQIRQNRLLKTAKGLIFVSRGMQDFFQKYANKNLREKPQEIVFNGFEDGSYKNEYNIKDVEVVKEFDRIKLQYHLVLLHSGSLYAGRNLNFFVECLNLFNKKFDKKICFILVGLTKNNFDQTTTSDCFSLPRVNPETSFYLQKQADALLMPIYKTLYTGFSGKVFEYVYSENIVIYDENPHKDLADFLIDFPNFNQIKCYIEFENLMLNIMSNQITALPVANKDLYTRKHSTYKLFDFLNHLKINLD